MTTVKPLATSAKAIQDSLENKGFTCIVKELPSSTRTANDAAASIGCEVSQIVKSLLFLTKQTNQTVLVLASGANRVDEKRVSVLLGEKLIKADAKFTKEVTGFAIGGIPPLGHKQKINHVLIDEDLLNYQTLWAAAGTPNAVFEFESSSIETLTDGTIASIK